jgi:hypothetical protein
MLGALVVVIILRVGVAVAVVCYNRSMTTDKKKPDQSKISLAPLTFEEALKGLLATPPPPKEPKPKKDGGKQHE